ncbi:MAG: phospholipase [Alphaproteobacteria bacterium]|nr:phospholipase [Alphaproteobacteria bacterium]
MSPSADSRIPSLDGPRLAPASGGPPRQLVILLHGYGSNGADMIQLAPIWQAVLPDALFLAPNAPERCPMGGFQWWALTDFSRLGLAAGVRRAAPALDAYIDAQLAAHGIGEADLMLVGFSQGTMVALQIGPCRKNRLAGIVGYSGMIADPSGLARHVRSKPPILLVHGSSDGIVPVAAIHEAEAELHRLGFQVTKHVSRGLGHGVDPVGLDLGRGFARKVLLGA